MRAFATRTAIEIGRLDRTINALSVLLVSSALGGTFLIPGTARAQTTVGNASTPAILSETTGQTAPVPSAQTVSQAPEEPRQEADQGLTDIVVTAEKRSTALSRTPVAVTALSGDQLQEQQVRSLADAQALVPGLRVGNNNGFAQITIRGIGTTSSVPGGEAPVAVNLNEVYVSRPIAQLASIYDVSAIEALRGPQGTLYGRNATAGSVNITTTRPRNELSGYLRGTVGNYRAVNVEGAIGGALVQDKVLIRFAGSYDRHEGYGRNLATGNRVDDKDAYGLRGTVVLKPTPELSGTIILEHYSEDDRVGARHYFGAAGLLGLPGGPPAVLPTSQVLGGFVAPRLRDIAAGIDPRYKLEFTAATGILEYSTGPFLLKSVTGYRTQDGGQTTALDGGSLLQSVFVARERAEQLSEELQVQYDSDRLQATLGGFYFHEEDRATPQIYAQNSDSLYPALGIPAPSPSFFNRFADIGGTLTTNAYAVFGQATYELNDKLSLTAGLRYSSEKKRLLSAFRIDTTLSIPFVYDPNQPLADQSPPAPVTPFPSKTFSSLTPRFGVQYQATPELLLYANYAQGFKSGSFDVSNQNPPYNPEKITSYEAGVKFQGLNDTLRVNLAGFHYDYTDLQVLSVINLQFFTQNAGTARVRGLEAEVTYLPAPSLQIDLNATYLDSEYKKYLGASAPRPNAGNVDFSGNRLNNAPKFTANLGVQNEWAVAPGTLRLRGELYYSSRYFFTPDNIAPLDQKAFARVNAFLTLSTDAGWDISLFGKNLFDKIIKVAGNVDTSLLGSAIEGAVGAPRTYGLSVGYRF